MSALFHGRRRAGVIVMLVLGLLAVLIAADAATPPVGAAHTTPGAAAPAAHAARQGTRHSRPRARTRSGHVLKMIWGPIYLPSGASAFPTYHQLGVQVFQIDLDWAQTAPTKPANPLNPSDPAYQWPAGLDFAISQAAQYGMHVMLLVKNSPQWASGHSNPIWAPNNAQDYANFLIAASHRYPQVHHWMIWGEPQRDQQPDFQPMPPNKPTGPRRYALLLNAAYHALKGVSRANIVIGGNTWSFGLVEPADFIKWMKLPNGQPPPLDYYGHNPFGDRFPNLREKPYWPGGRDINDIDTLEAQLRQVYHRTVPLWLSEFTISSDHNTFAFNFHVSRQGQAHWLSAAFKLADQASSYVKGLGWFELLDAPPAKGSLTNGLLTYNLQPKPAYYAYQRAH